MFRSTNGPSVRNGEVTRHPLKAGQQARSGPSALYPFRLNFYTRPPLEEITIEEFEGWALDRLRSKDMFCYTNFYYLALTYRHSTLIQSWPTLKLY